MRALLALAITLAVAAAASAERPLVTEDDNGLIDFEPDPEGEDGSIIREEEGQWNGSLDNNVLRHLAKRSPKIKKKLKKFKKFVVKPKKLKKLVKKLPKLKKLKKLKTIKKIKKLPKTIKKLPKFLGAAALSAPLVGVPFAAGGAGGLLGGTVASAIPAAGTAITGFGIPAVVAATGISTGAGLAGPLLGAITNPGGQAG